jgi:hypothetical protein
VDVKRRANGFCAMTHDLQSHALHYAEVPCKARPIVVNCKLQVSILRYQANRHLRGASMLHCIVRSFLSDTIELSRQPAVNYPDWFKTFETARQAENAGNMVGPSP